MLEKVIKRLRRSSSAVPPKGGESTARRFAAVTITPASLACEAVKAIRKNRILAREAPRLPLPDCSLPDRCNCTYKKYADRRASHAGDRRVRTFGQPPDKAVDERRKRKGRRASDDD